MKELFILLIYLIRNLMLLLKPGGVKAIISENLVLRHQLQITNKNRKRAPKLNTKNRVLLAFLTLIMHPKQLIKTAIIIKPATLLKFHKALVKKKYQLLFTPKSRGKPGPKGPSKEIINAIIDMKNRNPRYGYRRIAMQIANTFNIDIDKDIVRRVLEKYYKPTSKDDGPSWLSFLGSSKDSLWSIDFFRTESIILKSYWIMVIMDQYTRRIIGFYVHPGDLNGPVVCRMFNKIISRKILPKYLSSDNDPLFQFHQWKANLRVLDIHEIKSIPYQPRSHPFIESLIKIVRQELLNKVFFWNSLDLERKLKQFQRYYNYARSHMAHNGETPYQNAHISKQQILNLKKYKWQYHCNGLFQLPVAA